MVYNDPVDSIEGWIAMDCWKVNAISDGRSLRIVRRMDLCSLAWGVGSQDAGKYQESCGNEYQLGFQIRVLTCDLSLVVLCVIMPIILLIYN